LGFYKQMAGEAATLLYTVYTILPLHIRSIPKYRIPGYPTEQALSFSLLSQQLQVSHIFNSGGL
jgi:hypothetical protein